MASGDPTPPSSFDMNKLFKPPQNPNPSCFPPSLPPLMYQFPPHSLPLSAPASPAGGDGAQLMALLGGTAPASPLETAASLPPPSSLHYTSSGEFVPPVAAATYLPPARSGSSKLPKSRRLAPRDRVVYDVDVCLPGELQPPQLEVSPITRYVSDPGLVLGRQIAVNRTYICYGLKLGAIRVLNINTALRSLLKGHSQRVTDMTFFAEDVHLLASASSDGRIFIRKICEGLDDSNKPQIEEKIIVDIQIWINEQAVHPRVCWHCHKKEILAVGIGNFVLKIDTTKMRKMESFSAESPFHCSVEKLIDGVNLVGKHDGEVTDLSMSQWMITRLVSASRDGTIKIWDDRRMAPLATIRPHDGLPIHSVAFLTAPHRPDHIVLVTAGPLNRELKVWVSSSEDGWLLPGESESWHCTQTLELRSSLETRIEDAFFNQVVALPQANLVLLANAKKNAIYAIHLDYGSYPASTRMDYVSEFMVTMPILSLTGTSGCSPDGGQVVQVYCVQTQAIQQYALDLSQYFPPAPESKILENEACFSRSIEQPILSLINPTESPHGLLSSDFPAGSVFSDLQVSASRYETTIWAPAMSDAFASHGHQGTIMSDVEFRVYTPSASSVDVNVDHILPPSASPGTDTLGRIHAPTGSPKDSVWVPVDVISSDQRLDGYYLERKKEDDKSFVSSVSEPAVELQNSNLRMDGVDPHLISHSQKVPDSRTSDETTAIQETRMRKNASENIVHHNIDSVNIQATIFSVNGSDESHTENRRPVVEFLDSEVVNFIEGPSNEKDVSIKNVSLGVDSAISNDIGEPQSADSDEAFQIMPIDVSEKLINSTSTEIQLSVEKGKKQKAKQSSASGGSFVPASPFNSIDLANEDGSSGAIFTVILSMQETMDKMLAAHKEMQKQLSATVAIPITKEGRRIEASLLRSLEKTIKGNVDALSVRFQEDNAKREKVDRDRFQELTSLFTNYMMKELPVIFEKILKKEISTIGPTLTRAVTPVIEKTISSAVADCFQRGVGEKAVTQLDKSISTKLETMVGRSIQLQFQSSGKVAFQESLQSVLESSVIPAFEMSCKLMFEQIDATFQKGMGEYTSASHKQFESSCTSLALTLKDAINSVSSIAQKLTNELGEGQQKLLAMLASGNQMSLNSSAMQQGNDSLGRLPMVEVSFDPKKELTRLVSEHKFEEAFTLAFQRSDVSIVSWLCSQVDLQGICSMAPMPLSQGVLLALFQRLAYDVGTDTSQKLGWIIEVATVINPSDPTIAGHVRPIFEQIRQILVHQRSLQTTVPSQATSIRLILHVINSVLSNCK